MDEQGRHQRRETQYATARYVELRNAAVQTLKSKPLGAQIAAALDNQAILKVLRKGENAERWKSPNSVATAMRTVSDRRQAGRLAKDRIKPQEIVGNDIAWVVEATALRLRTSDEATQPLIDLANRIRDKKRTWPWMVRETAEQTFLWALTATDTETDLGMIDVISFHASKNTGRITADIFERDPYLETQVKRYWDVWRDLIAAYNREVIDDFTIESVLEVLVALQDGYLAKAAGMDHSYGQRCATSFAHGVKALLDGLTSELPAGSSKR